MEDEHRSSEHEKQERDKKITKYFELYQEYQTLQEELVGVIKNVCCCSLYSKCYTFFQGLIRLFSCKKSNGSGMIYYYNFF